MSKINGSEVKRELTELRTKADERIAVLSGFVRVCCSLVKRAGEIDLWLDCQTAAVRDYIASLMRAQFSVAPIVQKERGEPGFIPGGNDLVYPDGEKLLRNLLILRNEGSFEPAGIPDSLDRACYARGVFLGCGSLSVPRAADAQSAKSGGYHIEFSFSSESLANDLIALLAEYSVYAHLTVRSDKYVVYVKDSENVSDCLALIGAGKTVIKLNEAVAAFAVKSDINRRINCEMANMTRTVDASLGVADAIAVIDKTIGIDKLDEKLRVVAVARLRDPQAPLAFLAAELGISKSGLKHRLDKITDLASKLKDNKKEGE